MMCTFDRCICMHFEPISSKMDCSIIDGFEAATAVIVYQICVEQRQKLLLFYPYIVIIYSYVHTSKNMTDNERNSVKTVDFRMIYMRCASRLVVCGCMCLCTYKCQQFQRMISTRIMIRKQLSCILTGFHTSFVIFLLVCVFENMMFSRVK